MGYLFLFTALFFGVIKTYCGKKTSYAAICTSDAIIINVVRMILCCVFGAVLILLNNTGSFIFFEQCTLWISALSGISTASFLVCWLLSVSGVSYMIVEVFVMAGVMIPVSFSSFLYGERLTFGHCAGIVFLIIAVHLICTYEKKSKISVNGKSFSLLAGCAISSGMTDFLQKYYMKEALCVNIALFNLYTYLFAGIILLIAYFIFSSREKRTGEKRSPAMVVKPILPYVAIMAVCLFLNSFFKTLSADYLDAVLLYPLNQGVAVVLAVAMSVAVFHEKINFKGIFGVVLALMSVIIIHFA